MQVPTVTEITREAYIEAQKAWHQEQVRRVRASLLQCSAEPSGAEA
jgi:hypothetical protein